MIDRCGLNVSLYGISAGQPPAERRASVQQLLSLRASKDAEVARSAAQALGGVSDAEVFLATVPKEWVEGFLKISLGAVAVDAACLQATNSRQACNAMWSGLARGANGMAAGQAEATCRLARGRAAGQQAVGKEPSMADSLTLAGC